MEAPLKAVLGGKKVYTATTTDLTLLSPLLTDRTAFAKLVIAILQRVVTGENTAIDNAIGAFFVRERINTKMALNLITEDNLPKGPPGSIWQNSVFYGLSSLLLLDAEKRCLANSLPLPN